MGLRFRMSRGALPPSSLNDDPHRVGCGIVVDHSDHIEPFRNAGQVQGLVPRPCESANQSAIEASQLRLPGRTGCDAGQGGFSLSRVGEHGQGAV